MFLLASHHLARAIVVHAHGAKHGLRVAGSEGCKAFEVVVQTFGYIFKIDDSVDVEHGLGLFGLNMLIDVMLKTTSELRNIVPA